VDRNNNPAARVSEQEADNPPAKGRMLSLLAIVLSLISMGVAFIRFPVGVLKKGHPFEWSLKSALKAPTFNIHDWEHVWQYAGNPPWESALVAVTCFLPLLALFYLLAGRIKRMSRKARLGGGIAFAISLFVAHLGVSSLGKYGLLEDALIMLFPGQAGAYHLDAEKVVEREGAGTYLRGFHNYIDRPYTAFGYTANTRINVHPPGNTLLMWGLRRVLGASARLRRVAMRLARVSLVVKDAFPEKPAGEVSVREATLFFGTWFFQLSACLAFIPAYFLAKRIAGTEKAPLAGALSVLFPSLFLFEPGPDQFYPLLALLLWLAAYIAFEERSSLWAFVAGVILYAGLFFTVAMLVVGTVVFAALLLRILKEAEPLKFVKAEARSGLMLFLFACLGFVLPLLIMRGLFSYRTLATLLVCLKNHAQFYRWEDFPRTYWKWLLVNPFEFLMFSGGAIAALFVLGIGRNFRFILRDFRKNLDPCFWGFLAVFIALWISGKNMGEVARLWMFLMPAAAVLGISAYKREKWPVWIGVLLIAEQVVQIIIFRLLFDVYGIASLITKQGAF